LYWRPLGKGQYSTVALKRVGRAVYSVEIPVAATAGVAFEYYVKVMASDGQVLHFPATAPELNQTVVVVP
jgi:hypothetical protein